MPVDDAHPMRIAVAGTGGSVEGTVPAFPVGPHRRSLAGSPIGGIAEIQEMLRFCAQLGVRLETELVSAAPITHAWGRVLSADLRCRFVIDTHTR